MLSAGQVVEYDAPSVLLRNPKSFFYAMAKDARLLPSPSSQHLVGLDGAQQ